MITDLVQVRRLGESKRKENERLRRYLKRHNFVERRLKAIAADITGQIDCTACGNCCRVATARLIPRDVARLARYFRISPARFEAEYCAHSEEEGLILRRTEAGCVFLEGHLCTIYDVRPSSCEDFPHLVRGAGSFLSRMWEMPDRACYCPIVYNSLEAYKQLLGSF